MAPEALESQELGVNVLSSGRVDLKPPVTYRFALNQNADAYDLFVHQRDGVLKVAITP